MARRARGLRVALALVVAAALLAAVRSQEADAEALLQLKAALSAGDNVLPSWTAGSEPCDAAAPWQGVTCTGGRVTAV